MISSWKRKKNVLIHKWISLVCGEARNEPLCYNPHPNMALEDSSDGKSFDGTSYHLHCVERKVA